MSLEATLLEPRSAAVRTGVDFTPRARSTAMWLMPIAAVVEALITVSVMLSIGFIPPLVVLLVILGALAALGFVRPGPRVFLIGGIVLAVFIAMNLPFIIDGLIHPIATSHAWTDIVALVVGVTGAIAGFAAFAELRRAKPATRALRAPIGEAMVILLVGFSQKTLQLRTGAGTVYVVNADAGPHTFDIELNGRVLSYPVPARSTAAVVLDLPAGGRFTYWCAIPGHRSTMEGTLEVIE
jgi:hypothetical protein